MNPAPTPSSDKVSPVASALDCQILRHYSDFDTTSESEYSELSYVRPTVPKFTEKRCKNVSESTRSLKMCGARAARRRENEAFLSSLSMIVEVDKEEMASMVWPDSIAGCSAFAKLFEDDSVRAAWDAFVSLSEVEQAKLLSSLRRSDGCNSPNSTAGAVETPDNGDADGECLSDVEAPESWRPRLTRLNHANPKRRHPKRGHRKSKQRQEGSVLASSPAAAGDQTSGSLLPCERLAAPCTTSTKGEISVPSQKELRNLLPPRFYSVLNKSLNFHDKRHSRRCRRSLTTLDLCLIGRVESELRRCFSAGASTFLATNWEDRLRWTPTASLLSKSPTEGDDASPLRLNAFERLLVHCIASYLGLVSYSEGATSSADRQLWVEAKLGLCFQPPDFTFLQLLATQFSLPRRTPVL